MNKSNAYAFDSSFPPMPQSHQASTLKFTVTVVGSMQQHTSLIASHWGGYVGNVLIITVNLVS